MANIRIYNKNNTIYLFGQAYSAGDLTATNPAQDRITITRDSDSKVLVKAVPYTSIKDKDNNNWGSSVSDALTALNNYLGGDNPDEILTKSNKITDLTGVVEGDFLGTKPGYSLFSGTTDGSIQTSDAIVLGSGEIKLGAALDTNNFNITSNINQNIKLVPGSGGKVRPHNAYNLPTSDGSSGQIIRTNGSGTLSFVDRFDVESNSLFTSVSNGDIQITPNGTGSVNLDGTIKFKRFDAGATAPAAFVGGMYANDDDELFFGVTGA